MAVNDFFHTPVLLKEVIELLQVEKGKKYIDATLGGGGYAFEILKKGGKVLGIDLDQEAIEYVREKIKDQILRQSSGQESKIKNNEEDVVLVHGNFKDIEQIARSEGFSRISGIVFDLGLSSYQIEQSGRGFSFQRDEPLDMRMGGGSKVTAADLVNQLGKEELYELFSKLGEEQFSWPIIHDIIRARRVKQIENTRELVRIIEESVMHSGKTHPATRIFQALRIAVNDELTNLKVAIKDGFELLEKDGRMIIVSFQSLEDRMVKMNFRVLEQLGRGKIITRKPVTASSQEIHENIRSRSAKARAIEKV